MQILSASLETHPSGVVKLAVAFQGTTVGLPETASCLRVQSLLELLHVHLRQQALPERLGVLHLRAPCITLPLPPRVLWCLLKALYAVARIN